MRIQQINRSDAEIVLGVFYNATASTMAVGSVAQLDVGASADGSRITTPTTNYLDLVVGLVYAAITTLEYGFVQMYGYNAAGLTHVATGGAIAAGDKLVPVAGAAYLAYVAAGDGRDGLFAAIGTIASATVTQTSAIKVFIRCM